MDYDILRPWNTLDEWQRNYIKEEQDCFLLTTRQAGKSTAMSIKAGERAVRFKNRDILVIALTEKQAFQLFSKTLNYLLARYPKMISMKSKEKPTKHEIKLINGSIIRCYATGMTGAGLRGFSITDLFVDEASRLSDEVFAAIMPMLAVTKGRIDMASTPCGAEGYFYECSKDEHYKKFYVSYLDCPRLDKDRVERDRQRMTKNQFLQEYMAEFTSEMNRLFSDEWIKSVCTKTRGLYHGKKYLGVDVGFREDESSFEIIVKENKDSLVQIENITTRMNYLTDTIDRILFLHQQHNFRKIGIDDGGVGAGVLHALLNETSTKLKAKGLNNSSKTKDGRGERIVLKNAMYFNLLAKGEQRKLHLLEDDELIDSLKSIQTEWITKEGSAPVLRIHGSNSHITEGLIRACWLAVQDTSLELWAR